MRTKEEAFNAMSRKPLLTIGVFVILSLMGLVSFPFIWIWHSFDLAWKVGLSSLIAYVILIGIYQFVKSSIKEAVDQEFEKPVTEKKSSFMERLEQKMAEHKN